MENLELNGKSLLFVDDEADLREIVASELEFMGATVYQAENVSAAKMILQSKDVDLVVSDIRMPSGTGIDLLSYIKQQNISVPPIILITGFADISTEDALNLGAEALLSKPFKLDVLIQVAIKLTSPERERYMRSSKRASKDLSFYFEEALTQKLKDHEVEMNLKRVIEGENVRITKRAFDTLLFIADGDMRQAINNLQACFFASQGTFIINEGE